MKYVLAMCVMFTIGCTKSKSSRVEPETKRVMVGVDTNTGTVTINNHKLPAAVEEEPTIGSDFTYGQKVRFTLGFYKGCVGKIVGRTYRSGNIIQFDVDLDKKCDNQQIMFFSNNESNLLEVIK